MILLFSKTLITIGFHCCWHGRRKDHFPGVGQKWWHFILPIRI